MSLKPDPSALKIESHWILLRGLAREARHWGNFPEELSKALSPNTGKVFVEAIDLPGAGQYSEMTSPITISGITEFVREKYLESRERQRRSGQIPASKTYLVAVSLGGMIAAQWMERWPDDLKGTVLVNTSFKGVSPIFHRLAPQAYTHLFQILREKEAIRRERHVLNMISNRPELHEVTAEAWSKIQLDRPVSLANFARQLLAAATFAANLPKPTCPVLILNSIQDRMVSAKCSVAIAERWGAKLLQHPTAGHDLPLDDAAWLIEQIRVFYSDT